MIFKPAHDFYEMMAAQGRVGIGQAMVNGGVLAELWYAPRNITHRIVLTPGGLILDIQDIRTFFEPKGRAAVEAPTDDGDRDGEEGEAEVKPVKAGKGWLVPQKLIVPGLLARSNNVESNFLWDNCGYLLGYPAPAADGTLSPPNAKSYKQFTTAYDLHRGYAHDFPELANDPSYAAVVAFFENWKTVLDQLMIHNRTNGTNALFHPSYKGHQTHIPFGGQAVFRVMGDDCDVYELPACRQFWSQNYKTLYADSADGVGQCLLTGEDNVVLASKHEPALYGFGCATGHRIVSNASSAFCSHGAVKSLNAPMSKEAAFKYATAIDYLLTYGNQKVKFTNKKGDLYMVFWSADAGQSRGASELINELVLPHNPDQLSLTLRTQVEAVARGEFPQGVCDPDTPFFVAGFAPKKGRVPVRFFYESSFGDMLANIQQHYRDVQLEVGEKWAEKGLAPYSPESLLRSIKDESARAIFMGQLVESIITGKRYPHSLYSTMVDRATTPGIDKSETPHFGAVAFIKAYLNRQFRSTNREELKVSLHKKQQSQAYHLGRLFALLVRIQGDSSPSANGNLRTRFLRMASKHPAQVFPEAILNATYHLDVLSKPSGKPGLAVNHSKLLGKLSFKAAPPSAPELFPKTLSGSEQGEFLAGYYHQNQVFFRPRKKAADEEGNKLPAAVANRASVVLNGSH